MSIAKKKFKPGDLVQLHKRDWQAIDMGKGKLEDLVGMILSEDDPFIDPQEIEPTYTVLWFKQPSWRKKYNYGFELQQLEQKQTKG